MYWFHPLNFLLSFLTDPIGWINQNPVAFAFFRTRRKRLVTPKSCSISVRAAFCTEHFLWPNNFGFSELLLFWTLPVQNKVLVRLNARFKRCKISAVVCSQSNKDFFADGCGLGAKIITECKMVVDFSAEGHLQYFQWMTGSLKACTAVSWNISFTSMTY